MSTNGYKRHCEATTKVGKPCQAQPMKGQAYCLAHCDEKQRISTGFGVNGGRPRKVRVIDELKQRVEESIDEWLQPFMDARYADRAVVVGNGPKARVEFVPDHPTRIRAAEAVLDRVYGRPAQALIHREGESEVDAEIRRLLEVMGDRDGARGAS